MKTIARATDLLEIMLAKLSSDPDEVKYGHLPTGFESLDLYLGGFKQSSLNVIASRPGMGKTALTLAMARNIANQNISVGYISSENTSEWLLMRMASANTAGLRVTGGDHIEKKNSLISLQASLDIPLFLTTTRLKNLEDVLDTVNQMSLSGVEVIFIDSLQPLADENNLAANIVHSLHDLAVKNKIAFIVTTQVSKKAEKRGGEKKPQLSDVIWAKYLEDIANNILALYRPAYYGIVEDCNGNSIEDVAELIDLKNMFYMVSQKSTFLTYKNGWFSE